MSFWILADDGNSLAGTEGTALDGEHKPTHGRDEGHEREGDSSTDPEATDQNHRTRSRVVQVSPRRPGRGNRARDQSEVQSGDSDSDAREDDPG